MSATAINPTEQQTDTGQDPDSGKLFEVPRVGVLVDDSDPTVIKLSFSGALELTRANPKDVQFYNDLQAGRPATLTIEAHVAGQKKTHRRDSEGDVDSIVETKSLVVHSITGLE